MTLELTITSVVALIVAIFASQGFWAFLTRRFEKKSTLNKVVRGLAHNEIIRQSSIFIRRGWITKDEFEDFIEYSWLPYEEMGGNGVAEQMANRVKALEIRITSIDPNTGQILNKPGEKDDE